jgi:hypothetical protein
MWSLNLAKRKARIADLEATAKTVARQLFEVIRAEPEIETLEEYAV